MKVLLAALAASLLAGAVVAAEAPAKPATEPSLYVYIYRTGPAWKEGLPMAQQDLKPHAEYIKKLFDEGRIFAGGRFEPATGGMAIVRASTREEADAILAADPAITMGVFAADVVGWVPRFHSDEPLLPK